MNTIHPEPPTDHRSGRSIQQDDDFACEIEELREGFYAAMLVKWNEGK